MDRMTGVVTRVLLNRGFAFIRGADGLSRFLHVSEMLEPIDFDRLREGQPVTFIPAQDGATGNKLRAKSVMVIKTAE